MKRVTVLPGQTLFDVVVQEKGSLDGLFSVLASNNLRVGQEVSPGDIILIEGEPTDRQRLRYITQKNIKPATRLDEIASGGVTPGLGGIGYWIIEDDFVVS